MPMVCGDSSRQSVEEKQNQKQDVALRRKGGRVKASSEEAPVCGCIRQTVTAPHWRRCRSCVPAERSSFVSDRYLRHPALVPRSTLRVHTPRPAPSANTSLPAVPKRRPISWGTGGRPPPPDHTCLCRSDSLLVDQRCHFLL